MEAWGSGLGSTLGPTCVTSRQEDRLVKGGMQHASLGSEREVSTRGPGFRCRFRWLGLRRLRVRVRCSQESGAVPSICSCCLLCEGHFQDNGSKSGIWILVNFMFTAVSKIISIRTFPPIKRGPERLHAVSYAGTFFRTVRRCRTRCISFKS